MNRLSALLILCFTACDDGPDLSKLPSVTERRVRERAQKEQAIGAIERRGPPQALGELKDFDVVGDAGVPEPGALQPLEPAVGDPPVLAQPDSKALIAAWAKAEVGDFVTVRCKRSVSLYGNRVTRTVQLVLDVVDADKQTVTVRVRGTGREQHDSTNPRTKNKHWAVDMSGAAKLTLRRAPDAKLGAPVPVRNLAEPKHGTARVGNGSLNIRCAASSTSAEADPKERCLAADPGSLYLTAGLLSELSVKAKNGCEVTDVARAPPTPLRTSDVDAAQYALSDRGRKFRERVLVAAAGMVRVELQGLQPLHKEQPSSVVFDGKHYAPKIVDTRKLHLLDWAIQRVMPSFPTQLAVD